MVGIFKIKTKCMTLLLKINYFNPLNELVFYFVYLYKNISQ